jgi:transposase InsO family protein
MTNQRGLRNQYIEGLEDIVKLLRGCREPTILHTDQGSVYASIAYNELIKDTNIVRSMSRAGKPTDNPVNESLNGWIKEELYVDFGIENIRYVDRLIDIIKAYVDYYNQKRPSLRNEEDISPLYPDLYFDLSCRGMF